MKKIIRSSLLCGTLLLSVAQTPAQETTPSPGMTTAMTKSIDPQVYSKLMSQIMTNPMGTMMNPSATCAQCHSGEELERITQSLGPMMQMMNPAGMMNPGTYTGMMAAPMDPQTYTKWYESWMKKFGGMAGQSAPAPAE